MCEDSVSMQPRRQEIIEGLKQLPGNELIMFWNSDLGSKHDKYLIYKYKYYEIQIHVQCFSLYLKYKCNISKTIMYFKYKLRYFYLAFQN